MQDLWGVVMPSARWGSLERLTTERGHMIAECDHVGNVCAAVRQDWCIQCQPLKFAQRRLQRSHRSVLNRDEDLAERSVPVGSPSRTGPPPATVLMSTFSDSRGLAKEWRTARLIPVQISGIDRRYRWPDYRNVISNIDPNCGAGQWGSRPIR